MAIEVLVEAALPFQDTGGPKPPPVAPDKFEYTAHDRHSNESHAANVGDGHRSVIAEPLIGRVAQAVAAA
jgi:hypothetical protein